MKQIWPNYSYSPATNVLTLTGLNIDRDQLLLVAAPERGRIMYNFADSAVTASAYTAGANTALTLVASTAGLTTTASLVIYYDDQLQSTAITISNLPSTQTIAGTVTASVRTDLDANSGLPCVAVAFDSIGGVQRVGANNGFPIKPMQDGAGNSIPLAISGTVTIGSALPDGTNRIGVVTIGAGTVTIGAGTAQIGSVTASISNFPATQTIAGTVTANAGDTSFFVAGLDVYAHRSVLYSSSAQGFNNDDGRPVDIDNPLPISGTVTVGNSVTIASFATSVTARLINPAGTAVTYAEVGTAGSPSIDVLSVQGVSGGTSLLIGGTTGSFTTRFGSVTTANTAQISTAVTNLSRKYLFVQNVTTSSNVITLGIGFTPTTTQGIQLAAGALIDFQSSFIPTGAVYILSSVTGSTFTILEA